MEKKRCFKCGEVKPLSEFYKHSQMKDGHLNKCKECTRIDSNKHRDENLGKCREYDRERGRTEKRVDARKEYYKKNRSTEEYKAARLKSNNEYRRRNPEKARAHRILNYNVKNGVIKKKPCEVCGSLKSEAHHEDYSKPLEVVWLCNKHHKERHVASGSFRKQEED